MVWYGWSSPCSKVVYDMPICSYLDKLLVVIPRLIFVIDEITVRLLHGYCCWLWLKPPLLRRLSRSCRRGRGEVNRALLGGHKLLSCNSVTAFVKTSHVHLQLVFWSSVQSTPFLLTPSPPSPLPPTDSSTVLTKILLRLLCY